MKNMFYLIFAFCIFAVIQTAMSESEGSQQIVNLMIDVSGMSPSEEQSKVERNDLTNIYNILNEQGRISTMFLTQNVSSSQLGLYLSQLGLYGDIEFAMAGNNSDEKLSSMPYTEQLSVLKNSWDFASRCHACGINEKPILGFKPQNFDQNEDTFKALDDMGIRYDSGFQAGILYAPGHEIDVWPYMVEDHKFYALPVSTYTLSDKKIILQDSYFKNNGFSASQWYDALVGKFNDIQGKDEPLVILLTTSISGSGDYLDVLKKFLDYAKSKNASFVSSNQLVDMAMAGVHDVSALPPKAKSECKTCGQENSNVALEIAMNSTDISGSAIANLSASKCTTCGQNKSSNNATAT